MTPGLPALSRSAVTAGISPERLSLPIAGSARCSHPTFETILTMRAMILVATLSAVLCACSRGGESSDGAASASLVPPAASPAPPPAPPGTVLHDVEVKRHFLTSISETEVDRILTLASEALLRVDGSGDVPADARITRQGAVGTLAVGSGIINNRQEFDALFSPQQSGVRQVRVVRKINWCGEPGAFLGCADLTGYRIAVVRDGGADQEPLTWAHEFGHTIGLDHRDAPKALMRSGAGLANRQLNGSEAVTFLKISVQTPVSGALRP